MVSHDSNYYLRVIREKKFIEPLIHLRHYLVKYKIDREIFNIQKPKTKNNEEIIVAVYRHFGTALKTEKQNVFFNFVYNNFDLLTKSALDHLNPTILLMACIYTTKVIVAGPHLGWYTPWTDATNKDGAKRALHIFNALTLTDEEMINSENHPAIVKLRKLMNIRRCNNHPLINYIEKYYTGTESNMKNWSLEARKRLISYLLLPEEPELPRNEDYHTLAIPPRLMGGLGTTLNFECSENISDTDEDIGCTDDSELDIKRRKAKFVCSKEKPAATTTRKRRSCWRPSIIELDENEIDEKLLKKIPRVKLAKFDVLDNVTQPNSKTTVGNKNNGDVQINSLLLEVNGVNTTSSIATVMMTTKTSTITTSTAICSKTNDTLEVVKQNNQVVESHSSDHKASVEEISSDEVEILEVIKLNKVPPIIELNDDEPDDLKSKTSQVKLEANVMDNLIQLVTVNSSLINSSNTDTVQTNISNLNFGEVSSTDNKLNLINEKDNKPALIDVVSAIENNISYNNENNAVLADNTGQSLLVNIQEQQQEQRFAFSNDSGSFIHTPSYIQIVPYYIPVYYPMVLPQVHDSSQAIPDSMVDSYNGIIDHA